MKTFLITLAVKILRLAVSGGLFDIVKRLVEQKINADMTGAEKKEAVHAELANLRGLGGVLVASASTSAVNWVIESVLVQKYGIESKKEIDHHPV